jgi:hypothetical protein
MCQLDPQNDASMIPQRHRFVCDKGRIPLHIFVDYFSGQLAELQPAKLPSTTVTFSQPARLGIALASWVNDHRLIAVTDQVRIMSQPLGLETLEQHGVPLSMYYCIW